MVSEIWKTSPDYQFSRDLIRTFVDFMETDWYLPLACIICIINRKG